MTKLNTVQISVLARIIEACDRIGAAVYPSTDFASQSTLKALVNRGLLTRDSRGYYSPTDNGRKVVSDATTDGLL